MQAYEHRHPMSPKQPAHSGGEEEAPHSESAGASGESGDDGCVADAPTASPPARKAGASRQAGKKSGAAPSGANAASGSAADDASNAAGPSSVCGICDKPLEPSEAVMRGTSSTMMHRDCLNAISYLERHIRQTAGPEALNKFKAEKPTEFKYRIQELLAGSDSDCPLLRKRRGASERARAMELAEEVSFYSKCFKQQYVLMLGERAFKQWFSGLGLRSGSTHSPSTKGDSNTFRATMTAIPEL